MCLEEKEDRLPSVCAALPEVLLLSACACLLSIVWLVLSCRGQDLFLLLSRVTLWFPCVVNCTVYSQLFLTRIWTSVAPHPAAGDTSGHFYRLWGISWVIGNYLHQSLHVFRFVRVAHYSRDWEEETGLEYGIPRPRHRGYSQALLSPPSGCQQRSCRASQ